MTNRNLAVTKDRLVTDLKNVVTDSEMLLKELAGELSDRGKSARARLMETLASARSTCGQLEEKAKAGVEAADTAVREHPYTSLGVAFGLGVLVGIIASRR